jgi:hypothetical protein
VSDAACGAGNPLRRRLRQQSLDHGDPLGHQPLVVQARRGPLETGVDVAHLPRAIEEHRSRKREDAGQLGQLACRVVAIRRAGDQGRVSDTEGRLELAGGVCGQREITVMLEHQRNDLEPLPTVFLVQLRQQAGLVMAIRAPASGQRHDHHFAGKAGVRQRDDLAVDIGKAEFQLHARIAQAGCHGARVEFGVRVVLGDESAMPGLARPVLADEFTLRVHARVIQEGGTAVEAREPQQVAVDLSRQETLVA